MGVSGGGGDPRLAFVVDTEAVEANLLTPLLGICSKSLSATCGLAYWLALALGLAVLTLGGG